MGINNDNTYSDPELTAEHAHAWAQAVSKIREYVAHRNPPLPNLTIAAGVDFEPQWSNYDDGTGRDARTWAKAYNNPPTSDYYNFGSTSGYPKPALGDPNPPVPLPWCCSSWRVDQLYELSWSLPGAHVLPEIYESQAARDWYQVKRWAYDNNRSALQPIAGELTQCGDGGCHSPTFNCPQAWQVLWQELNADQRSLIQQDLQLSTDIKQR